MLCEAEKLSYEKPNLPAESEILIIPCFRASCESRFGQKGTPAAEKAGG